MPDILKVTTPVTGHDTAIRQRPQGAPEPNVQNVSMVDPTRVTQANSQNVNTDPQQQFSPYFESNYDRFMAMLRDTPGVAEMYKELFFARTGFVVNAGIGEDFAAELSQFMDLLKMSEAELAEFVKAQAQSAVKFEGSAFDAMRDILVNSKSTVAKEAVLDLLRKFDSMTSNGHILNEIVQNLKSIAQRMPSAPSAQLSEMAGKLLPHENGQNAANLNVIKGEVLPFLSEYVSSTRDFGTLREFITLFTLNLARYESGSSDSFLQSFRTAMESEEVAAALSKAIMTSRDNPALAGIDLKTLDAKTLEQLLNINRQGRENALADRLIDVITRGARGEAGALNRPVFENILQSALINESVYMPLLHIMIPADVDGRLFFSEIWVDPNADDGASSQDDGMDRAVKMLVKFDIKNVGYFELIVLARGEKVDIQLFYPESFAPIKNQIRDKVSQIATGNNLAITSLALGKVAEPVSISEVFPKIHERKNSINVVI